MMNHNRVASLHWAGLLRKADILLSIGHNDAAPLADHISLGGAGGCETPDSPDSTAAAHVARLLER